MTHPYTESAPQFPAAGVTAPVHTSGPVPPAPPAASAPAAPAAPAETGGPVLRFRFVALAAIGIAVTLVALLMLRDHGSSSSTSSAASQKLAAAAVTETQIADLATSVGHPVYWLGPQAGTTYELSRGSNGTIFIRYLPAGVKPGSTDPYLTVATYPFSGAFAALQQIAQGKDASSVKIANGGLAVVSSRYPDSVHVAYPGLDYQVEVYDPKPGAALSYATHGQLTGLGKLTSGPSAAHAVTPAALSSFASALDHPIYWVGKRPGSTYELTQTQGGQIYVRYLPRSVAVGAPDPFLTVATYPFPGAYGAMQALAKQHGTTTFHVAGGGLAVLDGKSPKSIHVAYPGSDYQIEVFDPNARVVRNLISSGKLSRIG